MVVENPENCQECKFRMINNKGIWNGFGKCGVTKEIIGVGLLHKPLNCPLQKLPERKIETNATTDFEYYRMQGFNLCLDEIMEGRND